MTFIVVPHGGSDLGTRSFEVSYRRLRLAGLIALMAFALWVVSMASWVLVATQAARVPMLQREVSRLQEENARVVQLAASLHRLEARYEQVRQMLGADRADSGGVWLPPAQQGADSAAAASGAMEAADSVDSEG